MSSSASEHFAAAFDDERQRPSEHDERAGADREEQRMTDREADGDAERPRALQRRRLARRTERQRRDRHQVISAETMKKTQGEGRGDEEHGEF